MTKLVLELPDELAGDLRSLATQEGKPIDRYAISALIDHTLRTVSQSFFAEPPQIEEGSLEEDAALDEAINSAFHPFDPEEAHRKISHLQQ